MDETTKPMENETVDSPIEDNPVEIVDNPAEETSAEVAENNLDTDIPEEDKELFTEFGEIIGETIVDALKEVYGEEKANEVCTEIAQEARDSEQPIQDIIGEKVSQLSGIDLEARVDAPLPRL